MNSVDVILGPMISEKSMNDASKGRYTFRVAKAAGKKDIKKAVEARFKVTALKISTVTVKGRTARAGAKRTEISQSPFKKAVVTVGAGQKISIFDTGATENK